MAPLGRLPFHKPPEPLDRVRIRQEQRGDPQPLRQALHRRIALTPGVVQDRGDGPPQSSGRDRPRQIAHRFAVRHRRVGDGRQFPGDGVPGPGTSKRRRPDERPDERPAIDHRRHRNVPNTKGAASTKNTCSRPAVAPGRGQPSFLGRDRRRPDATPPESQRLQKPRTRVGSRRGAVNRPIRSHASAAVRTEAALSESRMASVKEARSLTGSVTSRRRGSPGPPSR